MLRKGTKSRPNVKMPKYYHNDYEPFSLKRLSPSQAGNSGDTSHSTSISGMKQSNRSSAATSTSTTTSLKLKENDDIIVKIEAPDIEEHSFDFDPLELPILHSDDETTNNKLLENESDKSETHQDRSEDDDLKDPKIFPQLKIITLKPESLLKTNQIKVIDPIKLKQSKSAGDVTKDT